MSHKPSQRRHKLETDTELNITPIMNLMIVLVPFLLLAAVFSKTSVLNIYLPTAEDEAAAQNMNDTDEINLTVAILQTGFSIAGMDDKKIPEIKLKNNNYDYNALSKELKKIKEDYTVTDNIVLLIEPDISYDIIVHAMDATREIKEGKKVTSLFSNVSLADNIIIEEEEKIENK